MKQKLTRLAVLTTLILAPLSSKASLQMLMGGEAEPDPNAMHFPTFFNKAPSGKKMTDSASFLSQNGKRTLKLTAEIVTADSKKSRKEESTLWKTKEEEEMIRSHLPSLDETPGADTVFEGFTSKLIEKILGYNSLPKPQERVNASFVSDFLNHPRPSEFFESQEDRDTTLGTEVVAESSSEHPSSARPFKRPRLTKSFLLDTTYASKERTTRAQTTLADHLSRENLEFTQIYLAEFGFLQLTFESFPTPEMILSNEMLMANARRISIIEGAVISDLQEWLEKHCNALYKKHVLDKGGESLYH
ncbi:MAG: hypothetical protein GW748_01040 [Alphaproteobacteria bacterium]|nr:hypothetical protein [Alphaproteobacteria bacterium]NCQ66319.1 hypothetical protein [Alphaproteobacteria bacterium]NCT06805.1 hypothetical protein [Alphaproteobacteria bacterium]